MDEARASYYSLISPDVLRLLTSNTKTLLDVGCGYGMTGQAAKTTFVLDPVVGFEIDPGAAEKAKDMLDQVLIGDIGTIELPFPGGYFDAIICADIHENT